MSVLANIISISILRFPQNLLIPGIDNNVSIQVKSNSDKNEKFKFIFEGENLQVVLKSEDFKNDIELSPEETKIIDLNLIPTKDGFGKLVINAYWVKIIEYVVKVKKVRESVPKSKINEILGKQRLKVTETIEPINPEDYIITMSMKEIQQEEVQLASMRESYQSSNTGVPSQFTIEEIDANIKKLAKGYLSLNKPQKSLELALELSNPREQIDFYYSLIRAYALKNLEEILQIVKNLRDSNAQHKIFKILALDQISINSEQAIKIALLIEDPSLKENLLINILGKIIEMDPLLASKLINYIDIGLLKAELLFNLAKKLQEINNKNELINVINRIIEILLKSIELKKDRKKAYKFLKDAMLVLAEIENPKVADSIIESMSIEEFKEKITKDLFDVIYMMVDEVRTKIESEHVFSQYILLNTYVSNVNNDIKNFSLINGNVSNNMLTGVFNFNVVLLSLFRFDFSILPLIDRIYNDIKLNSKKSIAYYFFPSINNYDDKESTTLKNTLNQFFKNFTRIQGQLLILNLDFIPYLGKPTIIISSESKWIEVLESKIKKIGDAFNLIADDSLFKGGRIYDTLKQVFPPNKCEIVNLVISYEFINDYNMFKTFIQSLL